MSAFAYVLGYGAITAIVFIGGLIWHKWGQKIQRRLDIEDYRHHRGHRQSQS